jgi:hypothetical protein
MPAPLDPAKRAAIIGAIRAGGHRNAIAREHNVSPSTVTGIAKTEGMADAFDRTSMKRATEARQADLAAERVRLAELLMADAFRLRERAWESQYQVVVVPQKGGGAVSEIVAVPTSAADFRNYFTSIGIIVDKVGVLTQSDGAEKEAASLIRSLVDDIRARHGDPEEPAGAPG